MAENCNCIQNSNQSNQTMEEFVKAKQNAEDQADYVFIQRVIQELTQSCAMNLPIPASAIPPLILQAAQYFWANDDRCVEERWYCLPYGQFNKCGPNNLAKLPEQIISVFGVYKTTDQWGYGVMGDFSLERMILNSGAYASTAGGSLYNMYGGGAGYSLADVTASLYEVSTFKSMFDSPLTYNYNEFSKELIILGDLGHSSLILQTWQRCKIQNLYKDYYFFRYCVCLAKRSMAQIMGTITFKLPGGVELNYQQFADSANEELQQIHEWVINNHSTDYFFNSLTI